MAGAPLASPRELPFRADLDMPRPLVFGDFALPFTVLSVPLFVFRVPRGMFADPQSPEMLKIESRNVPPRDSLRKHLLPNIAWYRISPIA